MSLLMQLLSRIFVLAPHSWLYVFGRVVQQQGVQLVTDNVSYELLKGSKVDFTTDLIRSCFEVRAFCLL